MPTTRVTLNSNTYTDLGATPCWIQVEGGKFINMVVSSSGTPAANSPSILVSPQMGGYSDIGFSGQNVYGKALRSDVQVSVIVVR